MDKVVVVVSTKLVLNTNYVLEEEIAENTVPLPPKKRLGQKSQRQRGSCCIF